MSKDFIKIKPCKKVDTRSLDQKSVNGWLLEIMSDKDGFTKNINGQVYMTTIDPGVEKGYHIHAGAQYFITCISGKIKTIVYLDQNTKQEFESGDGDFKTYEIPLGSAHYMANVGTEQACILCYRFPSWDPEFKEQLDIPVEEIETKESWKKIEEFVESFKNGRDS